MPYVSSGSTSIYYEERGRGTPIVFIHPPILDSTVFDYQMEVLERDYRVIRFDLQGHGQSGTSSRRLTYRAIARDIVRILDELHIKRSVICGYSMGATVALEFALTFPERTLGVVSISGMSEVSTWRLKSEMHLASRLSKMSLTRVLAGAISFGNADCKRTFFRLHRGAVKAKPKEAHECYSSGLGYTCTERLCDVQVPTLIIYGDKDREFVRYAKMLRAIPVFQFVGIRHMTHQIPTKAPHELHRAIKNFMSQGLKVTPLPRVKPLKYQI